jgi:hypothetical protein
MFFKVRIFGAKIYHFTPTMVCLTYMTFDSGTLQLPMKFFSLIHSYYLKNIANNTLFLQHKNLQKYKPTMVAEKILQQFFLSSCTEKCSTIGLKYGTIGVDHVKGPLA